MDRPALNPLPANAYVFAQWGKARVNIDYHVLKKTYDAQRLKDICQRALLLGTGRYKSVESILKHELDQIDPVIDTEPVLPDDHDNIRGPSYYH